MFGKKRSACESTTEISGRGVDRGEGIVVGNGTCAGDFKAIVETCVDGFGLRVGQGKEVEIEIDATVLAELPGEAGRDTGTIGGGVARNKSADGIPGEV